MNSISRVPSSDALFARRSTHTNQLKLRKKKGLLLLSVLVTSLGLQPGQDLRADQGDILWRFGSSTDGVLRADDRIGQLTYTSPAIGTDGSLYILADDFSLRALYPGGSSVVKWVSGMEPLDVYPYLQNPVNSPAVDASGTVWVGGITNTTSFCIYALNPSNGTVTWGYELGSSKQFVGAPAIDNSQFIYTPLEDCIVAVSPTNSTYAVRWAFYNESGTTKFRTRNGIALSADWVTSGTTNQYLYFPEHELNGSTIVGGRMNAILVTNTATAAGYTNAWTWDFPANSPYTDEHAVNAPSVGHDGTVYIGTSAGKLYALDPNNSTNRVIWTNSVGATMSSAVIAADTTLYVGTSDGYLRAIDPADGSTLWSFYATNSILSTPVIGADGAVYVATSGGAFMCLSADAATSSRILWSTNIATGGTQQSSLTMDESGRVFALVTGVTTNQVVALEGFGRPGMTPWPMFGRNNRRSGKYRPPYSVTDLGSFNGLGNIMDLPYWVNNSGVVAGTGLDGYSYDGTTTYYRALTWYNGSFTALGTMSGLTRDYYAWSVNNSGTVAGQTYYYTNVYSPHYIVGFRHTYGGTWTQLAPLHEYETTQHFGYAAPEAINNDGIVVGSSMNSSGIYHATRWASGSSSPTDLQTLAGASPSRYSYAVCVNQDGYVVGYSETGYTGNPYHGFLVFPEETMSSDNDLGTPSGEDDEEIWANGINDLGVIILYTTITGAGNGRAYFKLPSSIESGIEHTKDEDFVEVGLPGNPNYVSLVAINDLNQAVGSYSGSPSYTACIAPLHLNYMAPLNNLIDTAAGWSVSGSWYLNDHGEIVATAKLSGSTKGVILRPQD